jgi:hypothetical protein
MGNIMEAPQKLKIEQPHDPAISLLDAYPEELRSVFQKDT